MVRHLDVAYEAPMGWMASAMYTVQPAARRATLALFVVASMAGAPGTKNSLRNRNPTPLQVVNVWAGASRLLMPKSLASTPRPLCRRSANLSAGCLLRGFGWRDPDGVLLVVASPAPAGTRTLELVTRISRAVSFSKALVRALIVTVVGTGTASAVSQTAQAGAGGSRSRIGASWNRWWAAWTGDCLGKVIRRSS